MAVISASSQ